MIIRMLGGFLSASSSFKGNACHCVLGRWLSQGHREDAKS